MARWIRASDEDTQIEMTGYEFVKMVPKMVDGVPCGIILSVLDQGSSYIFFDDDFIKKNKPVNEIATRLLHEHRADLRDIVIRGDVVVATLQEFWGNE